MVEVSHIAKVNGNRFENENKFTNAVLQELLSVKKYSTSEIIHSEQQTIICLPVFDYRSAANLHLSVNI